MQQVTEGREEVMERQEFILQCHILPLFADTDAMCVLGVERPDPMDGRHSLV